MDNSKKNKLKNALLIAGALGGGVLGGVKGKKDAKSYNARLNENYDLDDLISKHKSSTKNYESLLHDLDSAYTDRSSNPNRYQRDDLEFTGINSIDGSHERWIKNRKSLLKGLNFHDKESKRLDGMKMDVNKSMRNKAALGLLIGTLGTGAGIYAYNKIKDKKEREKREAELEEYIKTNPEYLNSLRIKNRL
jgi:uncharacterized protein HemX